MITRILTDDTLTVFLNNTVMSITADSPYWDEALNALRAEDSQALRDALDKSHNVSQYFSGLIDFKVTDNTLFYKGEPVHNALTERVLRMIKEGFKPEPMLRLMQNIFHNPSYRSREQLYTFLEQNKLPITDDGCFMAYKLVREDFTDCYSGTFDNRPGKSVSISRYNVDDDPTRTCSSGLHVCSLEYLKSFYGQRLVAVKVNPADVVSVPVDYNNSKMRVCQYTVVEELSMDLVGGTRDAWGDAVVGFEDEYDDDPDHICDEETAYSPPNALRYP
jgi:hypothetical protein